MINVEVFSQVQYSKYYKLKTVNSDPLKQVRSIVGFHQNFYPSENTIILGNICIACFKMIT